MAEIVTEREADSYAPKLGAVSKRMVTVAAAGAENIIPFADIILAPRRSRPAV